MNEYTEIQTTMVLCVMRVTFPLSFYLMKVHIQSSKRGLFYMYLNQCMIAEGDDALKKFVAKVAKRGRRRRRRKKVIKSS